MKKEVKNHKGNFPYSERTILSNSQINIKIKPIMKTHLKLKSKIQE
jgi:hypothetical protein